MGSASTTRPSVAGTLNISISRSPHESVDRMSPNARAAAWRASSGMAAVATDTPMMPMGMYMKRKA